MLTVSRNRIEFSYMVSTDCKASQLTVCTIRRVLLYTYAFTSYTNRKLL